MSKGDSNDAQKTITKLFTVFFAFAGIGLMFRYELKKFFEGKYRQKYNYGPKNKKKKLKGTVLY